MSRPIEERCAPRPCGRQFRGCVGGVGDDAIETDDAEKEGARGDTARHLSDLRTIRQLALRSFVDEHIGDDPPFDVENASIKFPQLNSSISLRRAPRPGSKHVAILWAEAGESNSG
jgi:hypothetical protein